MLPLYENIDPNANILNGLLTDRYNAGYAAGEAFEAAKHVDEMKILRYDGLAAYTIPASENFPWFYGSISGSAGDEGLFLESLKNKLLLVPGMKFISYSGGMLIMQFQDLPHYIYFVPYGDGRISCGIRNLANSGRVGGEPFFLGWMSGGSWKCADPIYILYGDNYLFINGSSGRWSFSFIKDSHGSWQQFAENVMISKIDDETITTPTTSYILTSVESKVFGLPMVTVSTTFDKLYIFSYLTPAPLAVTDDDGVIWLGHSSGSNNGYTAYKTA